MELAGAALGREEPRARPAAQPCRPRSTGIGDAGRQNGGGAQPLVVATKSRQAKRNAGASGVKRRRGRERRRASSPSGPPARRTPTACSAGTRKARRTASDRRTMQFHRSTAHPGKQPVGVGPGFPAHPGPDLALDLCTGGTVVLSRAERLEHVARPMAPTSLPFWSTGLRGWRAPPTPWRSPPLGRPPRDGRGCRMIAALRTETVGPGEQLGGPHLRHVVGEAARRRRLQWQGGKREHQERSPGQRQRRTCGIAARRSSAKSDHFALANSRAAPEGMKAYRERDGCSPEAALGRTRPMRGGIPPRARPMRSTGKPLNTAAPGALCPATKSSRAGSVARRKGPAFRQFRSALGPFGLRPPAARLSRWQAKFARHLGARSCGRRAAARPTGPSASTFRSSARTSPR